MCGSGSGGSGGSGGGSGGGVDGGGSGGPTTQRRESGKILYMRYVGVGTCLLGL